MVVLPSTAVRKSLGKLLEGETTQNYENVDEEEEEDVKVRRDSKSGQSQGQGQGPGQGGKKASASTAALKQSISSGVILYKPEKNEKERDRKRQVGSDSLQQLPSNSTLKSEKSTDSTNATTLQTKNKEIGRAHV